MPINDPYRDGLARQEEQKKLMANIENVMRKMFIEAGLIKPTVTTALGIEVPSDKAGTTGAITKTKKKD